MKLMHIKGYLSFIFLFVSLTFSNEAHASAKTDTLTLYNGDKITCEVKKLEKGKLQVKTSDIGTLSAKWYKVAFIETKQVLEIVLHDRTKIYGTLGKADSAGYAIVSSGMMINEVYRLMDIVSINQIATGFWSGLEGSVSYGLSYAKGSDNLQSNFAANVKYRSNHFLNRVVVNSIISNNAEVLSQKQDATYSLYYYIFKRTFLSYLVGWQQNTELGIDNRIINGPSIGYVAVESNSNLLKTSLGVLLNIEESNEGTRSEDLEGKITATYDLYLFAHPKITLTTMLSVFPSLTNWGRVRSDYNLQLSWEIFSNFTFGASFYISSDNDPTSTTASNLDWGTTTSIGYTF